MKITRITGYQVDLPLKEGFYSWADQSFESFDSTVVIIETDCGISGCGETCPLGPAYLPAFAEGARAGMEVIAHGLIGEDPTQIERINHKMDMLLKGHPYAKSAVDIACWDIFGKAMQQPVYNLLGGLFQEKVKLFKVVTRQSASRMADSVNRYQDQGFRQFQMKVGAGADDDIVRIEKVSASLQPGCVLAADANCGWYQHEAIRVVRAVRDIDVYIEQPCTSYEECLAVRQHTDHPMILDECMDSLNMLIRGYQDRAMDLVNLKINRIGGLTRAKQFRDLCVSLGITMTIEDSWGGEIATAAIAHLAHSTPADFHFQSSAFHEYHSLAIASGGPVVMDGMMFMDDCHGLGVSPDMSVLGAPVFDVSVPASNMLK